MRLEGAEVLVVGAGHVAWRKVQRLLSTGARVTLVAPKALAEIAARQDLDWQRRTYRSGEATDYRLVFAATDDARVNAMVAAEATAAGRLVNVTDDPDASTFYLPAQIRRGALQLNLATDGGAPFVARRLRERWESWLGPEWADWLQSATRFRTAVLQADASPEQQQQLFDRFATETVASDGCSVRSCRESEWRGWISAASLADPDDEQ